MGERHETFYDSLVTSWERIPNMLTPKAALNEDKVVKKVIEDVFLYLLPALKETYANEIALLGYKSGSLTEDEEWKNRATLLNAIICKSVEPIQTKVQKEVERAKEKLKCVINDRSEENYTLGQIIESFGLTIKEIKRDGHSLFRAVEDQLALHSRGSSYYGYQELRGLAASYMREHASEFCPYFIAVNPELARSDIPSSEKFEKHCQMIESTDAMGGFEELEALAHCLKRHIILFCGFQPALQMGMKYEAGGEAVIYISYHRVLNELDTHYNSLVPK